MSAVYGKGLSQKEIDSINKMRKDLEMPLLVFKDRPCNRCGKNFESEGRHNRMCYKCRALMDGKRL